jgi:hypothetical protein
VNDTSPEMDKMIAERYKLMTPVRRMRIASSMLETARAIIESSLPPNLTPRTPPCVREKTIRSRIARCGVAGVRRVGRLRNL